MSAPLWLKKDYRVVGYTLLSSVVGVIIMRLIVYYAPMPDDTYGQSLLGDMLFSLPTQLLFFLVVPFTVYMFYGRRTSKQTLEFSSIGEFKPYYLLALPLGLCVYFLTIGVSSAWTELLRFTGYTVTSSSTPKPAQFVFGFFVADVLLTAVLPAVCEEFCMRGGLLSTVKKSLGTAGVVVLCGVAFGLFHQNIRQVFYTSLFGALAAFVTLKTESLYPAMLMHFGNNFFSVFFDYASDYGWAVGGNLFSLINALPLWALALVFLIIIVLAAALVVLMLYFNDRHLVERKIREMLVRGAAARPIEEIFELDNFPEDTIGRKKRKKPDAYQIERATYDPRQKIKPSLRDTMLIAAAEITALCTTVFTYVWGFFY